MAHEGNDDAARSDDGVDGVGRQPWIQCTISGRLRGDGTEDLFSGRTMKRKRQGRLASELDSGDHRCQIAHDADRVGVGSCGEGSKHVVQVIDDGTDGVGQFLGTWWIGDELTAAEAHRAERDEMVLAVDIDQRRVVTKSNRHRVHVRTSSSSINCRATQAPTGSSPPARNQA